MVNIFYSIIFLPFIPQEQSGSDEEEDEVDEDEEASEEEGDQKKFKFEKNGDVDYGAFGGDSDEDAVDDDQEESDVEDDENENEDDESETEKTVEGKILKNDLRSEVQKGLAIKKQLSDWDSLFECRIQIQKVLPKINQFPQHDVWYEVNIFCLLKKCCSSLSQLPIHLNILLLLYLIMIIVSSP